MSRLLFVMCVKIVVCYLLFVDVFILDPWSLLVVRSSLFVVCCL